MFSIKEIDVNTLKQWQDEEKSFRLIDVRSVAEFGQGMIQDGEPLPLHILPVKADELPADVEIVFYCRTGARSAQACAFMQSRGHQNVYNLRGGIMNWAMAGNAIVEYRGQVA